MNDSERELVEHIQYNKSDFGELGQYIRVEYIVDFLERKSQKDQYYIYVSDDFSSNRIYQNLTKEKADEILGLYAKKCEIEQILEYKKGDYLLIDNEANTSYKVGNKQ